MQKEHKKTKDIYRLDYQKMQLILSRLKEKESDLKKESIRKQNGNDELVDKIHQTEEEMKKINDEIG